MKSNYARYVEEREGLNIIENEHGFITFSINNLVCFVHDLYVVPESRRKGFGEKFVNQAIIDAKEKGCELLKGSVCPQVNNATEALKFHLTIGMKLESSNTYSIITSKRIK